MQRQREGCGVLRGTFRGNVGEVGVVGGVAIVITEVVLLLLLLQLKMLLVLLILLMLFVVQMPHTCHTPVTYMGPDVTPVAYMGPDVTPVTYTGPDVTLCCEVCLMHIERETGNHRAVAPRGSGGVCPSCCNCWIWYHPRDHRVGQPQPS